MGPSDKSEGYKRVCQILLRLGIASSLALALLACPRPSTDTWQPLDAHGADDTSATSEQFVIHPESVISLQLSFSPKALSYHSAENLPDDAESYGRQRSLREAQLWGKKFASSDFPSALNFSGNPVENDGKNLIVTINYYAEDNPDKFFSEVTFRQGRLFMKKRFEPSRGPRNSIPGSPGQKSLSSLYGKVNAFLSDFLRSHHR
ncbi:hypothetical protein ACXYN8_01035 [Altererythrobacter sp. CAU 1778]